MNLFVMCVTHDTKKKSRNIPKVLISSLKAEKKLKKFLKNIIIKCM